MGAVPAPVDAPDAPAGPDGEGQAIGLRSELAALPSARWSSVPFGLTPPRPKPAETGVQSALRRDEPVLRQRQHGDDLLRQLPLRFTAHPPGERAVDAVRRQEGLQSKELPERSYLCLLGRCRRCAAHDDMQLGAQHRVVVERERLRHDTKVAQPSSAVARWFPGLSQGTRWRVTDNGAVNSGQINRDRESVRTAQARLLVVEDDPNIVELLSASLRYAGFEVAAATDGHQALAVAREVRPDLVVLDVMMPGIDGFEVVRRMRSEGSRCPVLFLTARDSTEDKITGLTIGGDDYVTKPFSLDEVLARIRVVLRRGAAGPASAPAARLSFADIELDHETHEVWKAGAAVSLSPTEFNLLRYFMENPGRVLSKPQILDHVWHYDFGGDANVVESYVSYLRRKIDTTEPRLIQTLRGVGYVLRMSRD